MLLKELLEMREDILSIAKRNHVSDVKVFGSNAEGTSHKGSDVDLLIKFNEEASLFDLIEAKLQLEELLGVNVDVVSQNGLKDNEIGKNIKRSATAL